MSLTCAVSASDERNWVGEGGKGISITILAPQAAGLAENQNHLSALIQGEFVSNFSTYSAIDVLDWERREAIIVHIMSSPSYNDSVQAKIQREIGNLIPTTHFMDGKLIKTATGYNLQMSIIRNSDKMTTASYSGNFTFWDLNNLTGIRQASLELLQRMGVTLTAKAIEELTKTAIPDYLMIGRAAQAKAIIAQRQGNEFAALTFSLQAAAFDPSLTEAVKRSSILYANISSGSMGDNVRNDIQWRRQWVERLKETEEFFDSFNKIESMPYTLYYSNDIKQGKINYQNETVNISIETYLYGSAVWTLSIERALQAVYDGLMATKKADDWGLANWPQQGVTNLKHFTGRSNNFSVVFELLNNQNKVIGMQTLQAGGFWRLNWSGRPYIVISNPDRKTLNFQNVDANEITGRMTIKVASVNGKDAETAAIDGILQIRAISGDEVVMNDRFRFSRGQVQGFTNKNTIETKLVIPSSIWGDPVISIGKEAFKNVGLTSVTVPNSVTSIGTEAFDLIFTRNNSRSNTGLPPRVTIGSNVALEKTSFRVIAIDYYTENGVSKESRRSIYTFGDYYNLHGKKAGVYTCHVYGAGWLSDAAEKQKKIQAERAEERPVRLGWHGILGLLVTVGGSSSEWFDMAYPEYDDIRETAQWGGGANLGIGLTMNIRISDMIALATELNYALLVNNFWYGGREKGAEKVPDYVISIKTSNHNMNIPVLLRWGGKINGGYLDAGYQFGFPISSNVTVKTGDKFLYNKFENERDFSESRVKQDHGIVFGFGGRTVHGGIGLRFVYHLTKWDRAGTLKSPFVISAALSSDFY